MLTAKALYSLNGPSSKSINILVDGDGSKDQAAEILERFHLIMVKNIAEKPTHQYEWEDMRNYFLSALDIMEIEYEVTSKNDGNISNHYTLKEDGEFIIHDLTKKNRDEKLSSYGYFLFKIRYQRDHNTQGIMSIPTSNALRLVDIDVMIPLYEISNNLLIQYLSLNDIKCIQGGLNDFIEVSGDIKECHSLRILDACLQDTLEYFLEWDEIYRRLNAGEFI